MLSGGLDSRLLLGLMAEASNGQPMTTFTWGIPGADDVRYAAECARVAGTRHHFFELKPSWLLDKAEQVVRQSDGMGNVVNLHAAAALEAEAQQAQVIFKGFLGDAMFGFGLRPRHWADYDDGDRLHTHLEAYRDYDVLDFDLPEHPRLFTPAFQQAIGDEVLGAYDAAIRASGVTQLAVQRLYIDLANRVPRMTLNGVEMVRSRAAVRLPFADNDLVEFSLRIPPGFHYGRQLVKQAFLEAFPDFAKVPVTPTNLPQVACAREVALRAAGLVRWHLRRAGLGRLAGPEQRPYKDYNRWFRTELRAWVTDILLSHQSLERGYFNPDYVRQLVQAHMSGEDHAVRLGGLVAIELWHRQFIDGVRAGSRRPARELSPA
jgi:asparagine synthase (glutamine-hydrolysing)